MFSALVNEGPTSAFPFKSEAVHRQPIHAVFGVWLLFLYFIWGHSQTDVLYMCILETQSTKKEHEYTKKYNINIVI